MEAQCPKAMVRLHLNSSISICEPKDTMTTVFQEVHPSHLSNTMTTGSGGPLIGTSNKLHRALSSSLPPLSLSLSLSLSLYLSLIRSSVCPILQCHMWLIDADIKVSCKPSEPSLFLSLILHSFILSFFHSFILSFFYSFILRFFRSFVLPSYSSLYTLSYRGPNQK